MQLLNYELESLGLVATHSGPTTIKKRIVTVQHAKAGHFAIDEEDFLITLKPENGGNYHMSHFTVGFQEQAPSLLFDVSGLGHL